MSVHIEDAGKAVRKYPGLVILVLAFVWAVWYLTAQIKWDALHFVKLDASNIMGYVAPLVFTSALIERAVEVMITPWRDPDSKIKSDRKTVAMTAAAQSGDDVAVNRANAAITEMNEYKGQTRQYAFTLALILSVLAVLAGVRALEPLLDAKAAVPAAQFNFFRWYDAILTALLLAGGAAGIHAPVNAFTEFFEKRNT